MANITLGTAECSGGPRTGYSPSTPDLLQLGCLPDSFFSLFVWPFLGTPVNCQTSCDCGGPPTMLTLWWECLFGCLPPTEDHGCGGAKSCGPRTLADPGLAPLKRAFEVLGRESRRVLEVVERAIHNPGRVSLGNGNLLISLRPPSSGVYAPVPVLYYNSLAHDVDSDFGYGWSCLFKQKAETVSGMPSSWARITKGSGSILKYTNKNLQGWFTTPGGLTNALKQEADSTYTEYQADGTKLKYDASGRMSYIANPQGSRWTVAFDGGNRVTSVKDPFSRDTLFVYDAAGKIRRIADPGGRITTFTVSGGDLTSMTTPELCVTNLAYDGVHRMTSYTDPVSNQTRYRYDASNDRLKTIISPKSERMTYAYLSTTAARVTNGRGNVTTVMNNSSGNTVGIVNPLGQRTSYTWDTHRLTEYRDASGNLWKYNYRQASNLGFQVSSVIDPYNNAFSWRYDSSDRVQSLVDQNGNRTTLMWDGAGSIRKAAIDANNNRTTYAHNTRGQVIGVSNPLDQRTTFAYDSVGERIAAVDALDNHTSFGYSTYGQAISTQNPIGATTTLRRDKMNRVTVVIDPLGHRTTTAYDLNGNVISTTNPLGNVWQTKYDGNQNVVQLTDPLGNKTSFTSDYYSSGYRRVG